MADDNDNVETLTTKAGAKDDLESIIQSVAGELKKSRNEKLKAKIKTIMTRREEHLRALAQVDAEMARLHVDFKKGILPE